MKFSFTDEQTMFKDGLDRFLEKNCSISARRQMVESKEASSEHLWTGLASLGVLGVPMSESSGGFGGAGVEAMIVMQQLGKHLVLEPYIPSVILAGGLVDLCGTDFQKKVLIPELVAGEGKLAFAHTEQLNDEGDTPLSTTATQSGNKWVLNGEKKLILGGAATDRFIISAKTQESGQDSGVTLFIAESLDESITGKAYPLIDGSRVLDIQLSDLELGPESVLGTIGKGQGFIDCVYDRATAAVCAEALGVMEVVHEMTMDYLRTRRQFGSALSQFQVLQHRAVDMFINIEEVRSLVMNAAAKGWSDDPKERIRSVSAAKALTNRASRHVAQEAIQLHGGMGMTQELPLADYVRRLLSIDLMFGGERFQRQRFANADTQKVDGAAFVSPKKRWKQI